MKKFLPFSKRQLTLDRHSVNRTARLGSERYSAKSLRKISATSLNSKSIQVVRGAYNIDLNKVDSSFTKLHRACLLNDDVQVRKHIQKVDNNSYDSSRRYPIHLATVNGNYEIIKLLIENKADLNVQDGEGSTPLIKSIECGHQHLVKYLLSNNADPNIADFEGNTALHWAIMTESMIAIDVLLNSNKCDLLYRNCKDETPLHLAVRNPLVNEATYELMLRYGSDPMAFDQLSLTPLDIARACDNRVALGVLTKVSKNFRAVHSASKLDVGGNIDQMKFCEEYKLQYMTKNQENLEFEKKLIQLTAQIDRLKLDMSYMKEQKEKLEKDYQSLQQECNKLKHDNTNLIEQLNESKNEETSSPMKDLNKNDLYKRKIDLEQKNLIECRGHEEFLTTRALLQERINELKYSLNTMQT